MPAAYAGDAKSEIGDAMEATDKGLCHKAFALLERAQKKAPDDYQVYMSSGAIYTRCAKPAQSRQYYEKAIALAKHLKVQNQYTKSDIAIAYRALGNNAYAINYGKQAKKLFSDAGDDSQVENMDMLISDLKGR